MAPTTGQFRRQVPTGAAGAWRRRGSPRQGGRPFAARPIPVLIAGVAAAAVELLHGLAARLAGARGAQVPRARSPMAPPVDVAGRAPAAGRLRGGPPTVR